MPQTVHLIPLSVQTHMFTGMSAYSKWFTSCFLQTPQINYWLIWLTEGPGVRWVPDRQQTRCAAAVRETGAFYRAQVATETLLKWANACRDVVTNCALILHSKLQCNQEKARGSFTPALAITWAWTHTHAHRWLTGLALMKAERGLSSLLTTASVIHVNSSSGGPLCRLTTHQHLSETICGEWPPDQDCKNTLGADISNIAGAICVADHWGHLTLKVTFFFFFSSTNY